MNEQITQDIRALCAAVRQHAPDGFDRYDPQGLLSTMRNRIQAVPFTPEQAENIASCYSKGAEWVTDENRAQTLTETFTDALKKTLLPLETPSVEKHGETLLKDLKLIMDDIAHNYPLILGDDLPEKAANIIAFYKETAIPEIDRILEQINPEHTHAEHKLTEGNDHFFKFDENLWPAPEAA